MAISVTVMIVGKMHVCWIYPSYIFRCFCRFQIWQVYCDSLSIASHQDTLQTFVLQCVNLLVRDIGRHEDKITGSSLGGKLELLPPPHPRLAFQNVNHRLEMTMMVCSCLCVRMNRDSASPELLRSYPSKIDRCSTTHTRMGLSILHLNRYPATYLESGQCSCRDYPLG